MLIVWHWLACNVYFWSGLVCKMWWTSWPR